MPKDVGQALTLRPGKNGEDGAQEVILARQNVQFRPNPFTYSVRAFLALGIIFLLFLAPYLPRSWLPAPPPAALLLASSSFICDSSRILGLHGNFKFSKIGSNLVKRALQIAKQLRVMTSLSLARKLNCHFPSDLLSPHVFIDSQLLLAPDLRMRCFSPPPLLTRLISQADANSLQQGLSSSALVSFLPSQLAADTLADRTSGHRSQGDQADDRGIWSFLGFHSLRAASRESTRMNLSASRCPLRLYLLLLLLLLLLLPANFYSATQHPMMKCIAARTYHTLTLLPLFLPLLSLLPLLSSSLSSLSLSPCLSLHLPVQKQLLKKKPNRKGVDRSERLCASGSGLAEESGEGSQPYQISTASSRPPTGRRRPEEVTSATEAEREIKLMSPALTRSADSAYKLWNKTTGHPAPSLHGGVNGTSRPPADKVAGSSPRRCYDAVLPQAMQESILASSLRIKARKQQQIPGDYQVVVLRILGFPEVLPTHWQPQGPSETLTLLSPSFQALSAAWLKSSFKDYGASYLTSPPPSSPSDADRSCEFECPPGHSRRMGYE
eukprot:759969-Hanusia_phi.AAC.3